MIVLPELVLLTSDGIGDVSTQVIKLMYFWWNSTPSEFPGVHPSFIGGNSYVSEILGPVYFFVNLFHEYSKDKIEEWKLVEWNLIKNSKRKLWEA